MRVAGIVLCINDALFYLGIAVSIIYFTGRYDYAASVLIAPVLIHGFNFYLIVNEIFLSGSLLILFVAVSKYMKETFARKVILYICMFFIIWSHPIMLLTLFVFLPFIYPSAEAIKRNRFIILFVIINVCIRLCFFSDYDYDKIAGHTGPWIDAGYIVHTSKAYFFQFESEIMLIGLALYFIMRSDHKIAYSGLIFTPVLLAFCTSARLYAIDPYIVKYLYPVTLFLVMQGVLFLCAVPVLYRKTTLAMLSICLFFGVYHFTSDCHYHERLVHRIGLIRKLNSLCLDEPGHSKWYLKKEVFDSLGLFQSTWNTETLFFSAYDKQSPTIQLVLATDSEQTLLRHLPLEKIYVSNKLSYATNKFNPIYFDLRDGPYKELIWDSSKIDLSYHPWQ